MNSETTEAESGKSPEAFRTISEVASDLDVPQHVLRFWESKFAQVKPMKRAGGRRYYRPQDVDLLRGIRTLLYSEGLTIKGVQKILREKGNRAVVEVGQGASAPVAASAAEAEEAAAITGFQTDEPAFDFAGDGEPGAAAKPSKKAEAAGSVIPLSFADRREAESGKPLAHGGAAITDDARAALRRKLGELLDLRGELDATRDKARSILQKTPDRTDPGPRRAAAMRDE